MSLLDQVAPAPRKIMTLFYLVDTSGSMMGDKLGSVNAAMEEAIVTDLPDISSAIGFIIAYMLSQDYDGKVQVVNNQRISVTMRQSVIDAKKLAEEGKNAAEIKQILEDAKFESSIYIMVDTLTYLKKGGRITPAAVALGTLLKLKPVLQIQGEKLDAFAKARTVKQAKSIMIDAMKSDFEKRFGNPDGSQINLEMAYTHDLAAAEAFKEEVQAAFPNNEIVMNPLSLSVSCHIGPGALAIACSKKIEYCNS